MSRRHLALGRLSFVSIMTTAVLVTGLGVADSSAWASSINETSVGVDVDDGPALPSVDEPTVEPEIPAGDFDVPQDATSNVVPDPSASPDVSNGIGNETDGQSGFMDTVPWDPSESSTLSELDLGNGSVNTDGLEVVSRTETTTTYAREDGAQIRRISESPLNVRLDDGSWGEISTDLQSIDGAWTVEDHPLQPVFEDSADGNEAVTVTRNGHEVSFGLIGADAGRLESPFWWWDEWDTLAFRDVAEDTDIEYEVAPGAVKETVILNEVPAKTKTSWAWRLDVGDLTPRLVEPNTLELIDAASAVVLTVPSPIAWDSSAKDGDRTPAVSALKASITKSAGSGIWKYTVTADAKWLASAERVYPVQIDPTFNVGPSSQTAYKSDGPVFSNLLYIGNTGESPQRSWRSIFTVNYGSIPGNFIAGAQIGVGYANNGTTSAQTGSVWHPCQMNFVCAGTKVADYTLGTGWTDTTGLGVAQRLADRFAVGDAPSWMIVGNEAAPYSFKQVNADIWIEYWGYPTPSTGAPANGSVTGLTPTLNASASNPGGRQQYFGFDIGTDPGFAPGQGSVRDGSRGQLGPCPTASPAQGRPITGARGL